MAGWVFTVNENYPQHVDYAAKYGFWDTKAKPDITPGDDVFFWLTGEKRLLGHFRATSSMGPMEPEPQPWDDLNIRTYKHRFRLDLVSTEVTDSPSWPELQDLIGNYTSRQPVYDIRTRDGVEALSERFAKVDFAWSPEIEFDLDIHDPDAEEYRAILDIPAKQDERKKALRAVVVRLGQPRFRKRLIEHYGHCLVTGWNVPPVLEAAHIAPYRGPHTNKLKNGLLLRADVHTLFDLSLLTIQPDYKVRVAPALLPGGYGAFDGQRLGFSRSSNLRPDQDLLQDHNATCEWL